MNNKRGQMHLSFGMIFSIILIIAFFAFAFYGIQKFLAFQQQAKYHQFLDQIQTDVDKIWKSSQGSQELSYTVPSSIKKVCILESCRGLGYFCRNSQDNIAFPNNKKNFQSYYISHLDMDLTLNGKNEFCVDVVDSKIKLALSKDFNNSLVKISSAD
jgi:hypothetical protein